MLLSSSSCFPRLFGDHKVAVPIFFGVVIFSATLALGFYPSFIDCLLSVSMSADVLVIQIITSTMKVRKEASGHRFLPAFQLTCGDSCTDDDSMSSSVYGVCAQVGYLRIMVL